MVVIAISPYIALVGSPGWDAACRKGGAQPKESDYLRLHLKHAIERLPWSGIKEGEELTLVEVVSM